MTRRTMWFVCALLLVLPAVGHAQNAYQVGASATVQQYSLVTGSGDVAFGPLSRTADNTIDAAGGTGAATRSLAYNHNVAVTFTNVPSQLVSGSLTLPVSLTCAARVAAGSWSSPAACSGATLNLDVATALTSATLGFGGTITAANTASAIAATYTGSFDIVVTAR